MSLFDDVRPLLEAVRDGRLTQIPTNRQKRLVVLDWLRDPVRNGGGALFDFGCYGANLMTWLMDGQRPTAVTAITQRFKPALWLVSSRWKCRRNSCSCAC